MPASAIPLRPGCQLVHAPDSGTLTMLNLRDGETVIDVADAEGELPTSADGCTAVATIAGQRAQISDAGRLPVEPEDVTVAALSPDGGSIAVDLDGRLVVRPTVLPDEEGGNDEAAAADEGDGDLGPFTPYVFFADL
jgi:hypothetical protein